MNVERLARQLVAERSGGVCERCDRQRATNCHHRLLRSRGGLWCPSNLLHLCGSGTTGCHGLVTAFTADAEVNGWTVASGFLPADVPVLLAYKGWCLLLEDGGVTRLHHRPTTSVPRRSTARRGDLVRRELAR